MIILNQINIKLLINIISLFCDNIKIKFNTFIFYLTKKTSKIFKTTPIL
jgi:hypothetical protein